MTEAEREELVDRCRRLGAHGVNECSSAPGTRLHTALPPYHITYVVPANQIWVYRRLPSSRARYVSWETIFSSDDGAVQWNQKDEVVYRCLQRLRKHMLLQDLAEV